MNTMTKAHTEATWVSVRVPPDLREQLVRAAAEHDRTVSAEIRVALRAHTSSGPSGAPSPPSGHASEGQGV